MNKSFKICISVCLAFIITVTICFASDPYSATFDKIDEYVQSEMKASHIPGLSLGIVKGSETVYLKGFGVADPTGRAVTPQTPFVIASVSKSFTALAVMQLVEAGKIGLDVPVTNYISWFKPGGASSEITVRQLLNQTSGLSTYSGNLISAGNGSKTLDQLARELNSAKLASPAGKAYHYSNANYVLLADIVEHVSGESYDNYIRDNIYKPLEMVNSYVDRTEILNKDLAAGYKPWFGFPFAAKTNDFVPCLHNVSSAEDMTHYLIALMSGGVYKSQSICSADTISEMQRPAAKMKDKIYCGMGFEIDTTKPAVIIKHPGDAPGYNANIAIIPDGQWGIILMENINWMGMMGETNTIISGIEEILADQTPSAKFYSPGNIFIFYNAVYVITIALILRSFITLGRYKKRIERDAKRRLFRRFIPIIINNFCISIGMQIGIPKIFSANWHIAFLNAPDLSLMIIGISLLLLILGIIKITIIIRRITCLNRKEVNNHPGEAAL